MLGVGHHRDATCPSQPSRRMVSPSHMATSITANRMRRVSVIGSSLGRNFSALIAEELNLMGHHAEVVDVRPAYHPGGGRCTKAVSRLVGLAVQESPRVDYVLQRSVQRALRDHDPDLVLTVFGSTTAAQVQAWRSAAPRARVALWYPDHLANLGNQSSLVAGFDRIFVKDPYIVERLSSRGGVDELRYLPEAAPSSIPSEWNDPMSTEEEAQHLAKVAVVGNVYPARARLLERLPTDIKLAIYGRINTRAPCPRVAASFTGRYIMGRDKHRVFRYSKAVLNNLHIAEVGSVNFRMFDAASAGGLIVTDHLPQVSEFFEPGKEVLTYRSIDELVTILRAITPDERERIGSAAQARVQRDHTMKQRLRTLLDDLALS